MPSRLIVAVAWLLPFGALAAQNPAPPAHATLRGIVVDSVRGGLLARATVGVIGPSRMATTDSLGRFLIDSLPSGTYQVELFDPLLDTLSVKVVSPPTRFESGDTVTLFLAIPSPETIVAAKCGAGGSIAGSRSLFGQVLDALSEEPVQGARVTLAWVEVTIGTEMGVRNEPRQRQAVTGPGGHYQICGLPSELVAEAYVQKGADSTGKVQLTFGDEVMSVVSFLLPGAGLATAPTVADSLLTPPNPLARSASVTGSVRDNQGTPIVNAHVSLGEGIGAVTTDSAGRFSLGGQPPGTRALIVRRLGYEPVEITVNLAPRRRHEVAVRMSQFVPVLQTVIVEANRVMAFEKFGITRRRSRASRFIEREYIERRNAYRLTDLLLESPELRRSRVGMSGQSSSCITYWVDGFQWRGGSPDDFVRPDEIEVIEIYSPNLVPVEFRSIQNCATAVIWTRWKLRL